MSCRSVQAHGQAVGLPTDDDMGNSEVGHNALGSGQVVDQGALLVDNALKNGSMFESDGWKHISPAFEAHTLHCIGLLSNGGVHSRLNQLFQIVEGPLLSQCFIKLGQGPFRMHSACRREYLQFLTAFYRCFLRILNSSGDSLVLRQRMPSAEVLCQFICLCHQRRRSLSNFVFFTQGWGVTLRLGFGRGAHF